MSPLRTSAMIASIAPEGARTVAAPFGHALVALAAGRPEIVGMTADLARYTDLHIFAEAHPDRFYQMGMAEQLLFGAAAGLAREGFVPFATTYGVFASRRAYDFIYMAIAEERLDVKIACALPGLTTGYGPSHQATDDLAIFRAVPGLVVIDPCDALEIEQATYEAALRELVSPGSLRPDYVAAEQVTREKVGPIEVEYAESAEGTNPTQPVVSVINAMLAPLLLCGGCGPAVFVV